ncbi:MAG: hypothetical protein ACK4SY_08710 [Pyrobaculum sp.]
MDVYEVAEEYINAFLKALRDTPHRRLVRQYRHIFLTLLNEAKSGKKTKVKLQVIYNIIDVTAREMGIEMPQEVVKKYADALKNL